MPRARSVSKDQGVAAALGMTDGVGGASKDQGVAAAFGMTQ